MKHMLMSFAPYDICRILQGDKDREIRQKFPKDFQGWIYMYCTKNSGMVLCDERSVIDCGKYICVPDATFKKNRHLCECNGEVIGRFWCNKVYSITSSCGVTEQMFYIDKIEVFKYSFVLGYFHHTKGGEPITKVTNYVYIKPFEDIYAVLNHNLRKKRGKRL